jgi:hypothetical protein
MKRALTEGKDYNILPDGRLVFTAHYLLERGYCCGNGCLNCPYEYINVAEPYRSQLLKTRNGEKDAG